MVYNTDYYWGMNLIWWIIWMVLLAWIFVIPIDIPGQRTRRNSPLDILQKRFASGQISKEEYADHKKILIEDFAK